MIDRKFTTEILENFIKENSHMLYLNPSDLHSLQFVQHINSLTCITDSKEFYVNNMEYFPKNNSTIIHTKNYFNLPIENDKFNIVYSENSKLCIDSVKDKLKIGGHLILIQEGITNTPELNLENTAEKLKNSGFSIIKANQTYFHLGDEYKNIFFLLAKRIK